tara:strand:- start:1094 stop:1495 length:402 start_codon:yes stop_codon:yes gene_type:complete
MNKILSKIFGDAGVSVVDKIAGVADRFIRTKDEKAKFQKEMEQIWIQAESDMQKNVTERWKYDMINGNVLSKSVRPIVLLFLIFSIIVLVFVDSASIKFEVSSEWLELLKLLLTVTVSAYFGGRSYEKVKNNG